MNKSLITNILAIVLLVAGYVLNQPIVTNAGLFAFSGAITNWLAVHMLFEKVPGLYGSGVIPARFEQFKMAIKQMMMAQFFTSDNIDKFINRELSGDISLDLEPVINGIDFDPMFDSLVDVVSNSSFGGMLAMFGGSDALQPLKEPFIEKMKNSFLEMGQNESLKQALKTQFEQPDLMNEIQSNIENIIDQRLNELTPQLVKEMVQEMIKQHLGWLVVWGGVFGGVIGILAAFIQ